MQDVLAQYGYLTCSGSSNTIARAGATVYNIRVLYTGSDGNE